MKPTALLRQQHRRLITSLKKLEKSRSAQRGSLVSEISDELAAHMAIEQELFYPQLYASSGLPIVQAYEEHSLCELALKRLRLTETDGEPFRSRAVVLRQLLQRHIEDEERLFSRLERHLPD